MVASIDKSNSGVDALKTLTGEMSAGQVSTLVVLGGNPVYSAPADLQFAAALSKVASAARAITSADGAGVLNSIATCFGLSTIADAIVFKPA
jgi:molybdopterin-containing oxidoreductase family iron-sulfur binding subunit